MGNIVGGIIGGIAGKLIGGKKAKGLRKAGERAAGVFDPFLEPGATANTAALQALGQGGPGTQDAQFQNFLNSTGFREQLRAGSEAITGNQAARGLLNSGATLKRLNRFGQDLGQQSFQNFFNNLSSIAGRGLTAAGGAAGVLAPSGAAAAGAEAGGNQALVAGLGQAGQGIFKKLGI